MILITGGLGYLGSHLALELLSHGHEVVLVDNLSHASMDRLQQLENVTSLYVPFVRLDVRNTPVLQKVFEQYPIEYVIHAAGFKSIGESHNKPLEYYNNNIGCMMSILRALQRTGIKRLVNLSSLAVYGEAGADWIEDDAFYLHLQNPYIRAQQMNEQMLSDIYRVDPYWQIINVRLGNVIGADPEGRLGEWTPLLPKAILPNLLQIAAGHKDHLELPGELDTADGSAERDFIHIKDATEAIYQLMHWSAHQHNLHAHFNLASGQTISLRGLISETEKITQRPIMRHVQFGSGAVHDELAVLGADTSKLKQTLQWTPQFTVEDAIAHQWTYQQRSAH